MNRKIPCSEIPHCVRNDGVARERFLATLGMTGRREGTRFLATLGMT